MSKGFSIILTFVVTLVVLMPLNATAALSDYFVETQWLEANSSSVKVIDVRVEPLYLLGHIDGAIHIPRSEFLFTRDGVKSLIPTVSEFESMMTRFGISEEDTVIAYADDNNPYSARFVWMLRYHGHKKAYVLNGGYEKWTSEDRETALFPTDIVAGSGYKCNAGKDIRADGEDVLTRMNNPAVVIWDTRRLSEYQGEEVRADRGGQIPGAVHLNWEKLQKEVAGVKVLKSETEIKALLAEKGITEDKLIIAHCQTGIRSSYATLVLLGLGYTKVQNYDGSWFEWANDSKYPVVKQELVSIN